MMSKGDHRPKIPPRPFVASDQGSDDPTELERIAERNRLIIQVMEINAQRRHLESLQTGLTLEVSRLAMTSDPHLPGLRAQLKTVEEQLYRLAVQREWLTGHLAEIDGAIGPAMTPNESRN
jgi:hypothetical protein